MTPEEFAKQIKTKYPQYADVDDAVLTEKVLQKYPQYQSKVQGASVVEPMAPTYSEEFMGTGERVAERFKERGQQLKTSFQENQAGKQTPFETGAQFAGTALGAVGDVAMEGAKMLTPEWIENVLASAPEAVAKNPNIARSLQEIQKIAKENPRLARNLSALTNIISATPLGKGAQVGGKAALEATEAAVNIAKEGVKTSVQGAVELGLTGAKKTTELAGKVVEGVKSGAERVIRSIDTGTVSGIPKNVDEFIDTSLEKSIRPSVAGKNTAADIAKYKERGREAVKTIVANKKNLQFTDEAGESISRLPESLKETTEAIQQTKKQIFSEYSALTKQTGEAGKTVDLKPIAKEVQKIADNEVLFDTNPEVAKYAATRAKSLEARGIYTPEQAEEAIKIFNESLEAFYRNPDYANASKAAIDALVVNNMRKSLDDLIESATGAEYQALKNKYGALKTIEKDTVRRAVVEGRKNVKGLIDFSDILSGGQVLTGISTMNPALIASGTFQKSIASFYKLWNSPDSTIKRMFEGVEQTLKTK